MDGSVDDPREAVGLLCALPEELGELRRYESGPVERRDDLSLLPLEIEGERVLACVGGVGKVLAARAATQLLAAGARRALLVVGVCGGLVRSQRPGDLVHCGRAIQADLAVRDLREVEPAGVLLEAWEQVATGTRGTFLTADRPAIAPWRRVRLARSFGGAPVADMETAAAAFVAARAGVPWAALRTVTDGLWLGGTTSFRRHFADCAGRAAETVPALVRGLAAAGGAVRTPGGRT